MSSSVLVHMINRPSMNCKNVFFSFIYGYIYFDLKLSIKILTLGGAHIAPIAHPLILR